MGILHYQLLVYSGQQPPGFSATKEHINSRTSWLLCIGHMTYKYSSHLDSDVYLPIKSNPLQNSSEPLEPQSVDPGRIIS